MFRRTRRVILALYAGLVLLLLSGRPVSADELQTASLTFSATGLGARCPDEESFRNQVAARLGYQPFVQDGKHRASVTLRIVGDRVRGRAEVLRFGQSTAGVRELDGEIEKCETLTAALATAVAIALDPVRSAQPATPAAPPPPATDVRLAPPPPPLAPPPLPPEQPGPPPVQSAAPSRTSRIALFGTAGAIGAVGLMPGLAMGGDAGVGLRFEVLSLELSGRVETMPTAARADSGDRLEATMFSAVLSPCGHLGRWLACGIGRVGALQGRAPDVVHPSLGTSLFGAIGARGGYVLPLSSALALRGLASAEFPLVRTSLVIDKASVWTAPPAAAALELGVVVTVP